MDFMGMDLLGSFDLTGLGLDAAKVGVVNEMCNYVKERLDEWTWDDQFSRFYVLIPFLCSVVVCFASAGFDWTKYAEIGKCSLAYGLWATFTWNFYKKAIKGE